MTRTSPLRERWREPERKTLAAEFFRRIYADAPVHEPPLGEHEGRLDLRGVVAPRPVYEESWRWKDWILDKVKSKDLRGGVVAQIDFSGSDLYRLCAFGTRFVDCVFDKADCSWWKTWRIEVERCSFRRANLREAVLGEFDEGQWGVFRSVDFTGADMRGMTCTSADFVDCDFSNAKLDKWETRSCRLIRCRFAGVLRNVLFEETCPGGSPKPLLNPMEDVDLSKAELRWCEFRHVDLSRVKLPESPDHIVVRNARHVLRRALELSEDPKNDLVARTGFGGPIESKLHWLHPRSDVAVWNVNDLDEMDEGTGICRRFLLDVMAECGGG